MRCEALTVRGEQCRATAMRGGIRCRAHTGPVRNRPTMTAEAVDTIVRAVSAGSYIDVALAAAGVARATFYDWWRRGDPDGWAKDDAPFRDMRARVERAKAEGETRNVAIIARAASENWQAAAWILERSAPERWARPSQREGLEPPSAPAPADDPFAELDNVTPIRPKRAGT